jgi:uncharacterized membrane protein
MLVFETGGIRTMNEWTDASLAALPVRGGVRQRGLETTRLETFCDAAFAFAVTILVISSGGVPDSYRELLEALKDVPAFAASFASIAGFWLAHRAWSSHYGLDDGPATILSLMMVFVMLVYVYPLKMMFSAFASYASGGRLPTSFVMAETRDMLGLFMIYGVGFAAQTGMLAALHGHALRAPGLRLDPLERLLTKQKIVMFAVLGGTGLASALFAGLMPARIAIYAGFLYMTLPVTMPVLSIRHGRQAQRISERP